MLERLEGVLGVFQKLLATKSTDAHACRLLGVVFTAFDAPEVQAYLTPIFALPDAAAVEPRCRQVVGGGVVDIRRAVRAPALRAQLEAARRGSPRTSSPTYGPSTSPTLWAPFPGRPPRSRRAASLFFRRSPPTRPIAATLGGLVTLLLADSGAPKPEAFDDADDDAGANGALGGGGGGGGYQAAYAHFASTAEADLYVSETPQAAFRQCLEAVGRAAPACCRRRSSRLARRCPPRSSRRCRA